MAEQTEAGNYLDEFSNPDHKLLTTEELHPLQTEGSIRGYAARTGFKNEEEFIREYTGKNVCDMGSGLGGFEIDARLRKLPFSVTSVNAIPLTEQDLSNQNYRLLQQFQKKFSREEIESAIKQYNDHVVRAFAHNIPVPDNSFDAVFDISAVTLYTPKPSKRNGLSLARCKFIYKTSVEGMIAKVKPGGKLYLVSPDLPLTTKDDVPEGTFWEVDILKSLGHELKQIETDGTNSGIIVTKNKNTSDSSLL